ncbi:MAG: hypothetical protein KF868_19115 [Acidobacteria bacterium]|nr:hypothetical protein [Acidobacteriota bacterium]MCW5971381.1 hypothetical protein [Blastocatellales bacterium]
MKPLVNLAGEPFRNRRLFWLGLLLVVVVSSMAGIRMLRTVTDLDSRIAERAPSIRALELQAREMEKNVAGIQALTLDQTRTYWAANDLIARKAFSWTHLLNDIERTIPAGVRVLRVAVNRVPASDGSSASTAGANVLLTMEVVGKGVSHVTQMIADFNRTGIFIVTPKWQKPVEGTEEVEFGLDIEYQPPASAPSARPAGQQVAERKP